MTSRSILPADRRRLGRSVAVLVALVAVLAPARAAAQTTEPIELVWDAPAGCPSGPQVGQRIRKLAGSAQSTAAPLRAEATITRSEDGRLHLDMVVHAGDLVGTRKIDGRSCDDLAGAAAVALALLLRAPAALSKEDLVGNVAGPASPDGASHAREATGAAGEATGAAGKATGAGGEASGSAAPSREPSGATTPPARATSEPTRPEARVANDEPGAARRWRGLLQAPLAAFALGPLPQPSFGVAVAGGASFERWRFLVEGSAWRTQHMTAIDEPGAGADVELLAAGVQACWAMLQGRFELSPCVALAVEHVRARGTGTRIAARTAEATWLSPGVGAQARWRLAPWFGLFGGVTGQIEASRPRISIDGVGSLGQLWPASLTVTGGPEWIL